MNSPQPTPEIAAPKVSVIIPSFQSVGALRRALQALEASNEREQMEILVLDGGSRDGTAAIDTEFPNVTMMRQPRYFGATKLRNIGCRTAKGEHILFLEPSIEVQPDTIPRLAEALDGHAEWGAVCPLVCDGAGQPAPQLYPLPSPQNLSAGAAGKWPLITANASAASEGVLFTDNPSFKAFMARRGSIAGMNFFDERYGEYWSDTDYCYKLRKAGKKLAVLTEVRVTENAAGRWAPSAGIASAVAADRALGATRFAGKHFSGIFAAQVTMGNLLRSLGGGEFGAFTRIIGGQKIDGSEVIRG